MTVNLYLSSAQLHSPLRWITPHIFMFLVAVAVAAVAVVVVVTVGASPVFSQSVSKKIGSRKERSTLCCSNQQLTFTFKSPVQKM